MYVTTCYADVRDEMYEGEPEHERERGMEGNDKPVRLNEEGKRERDVDAEWVRVWRALYVCIY